MRIPNKMLEWIFSCAQNTSESGWDGYRGIPINAEKFVKLIEILEGIMDDIEITSDNICPCSDGSLDINIETKDYDYFISIEDEEVKTYIVYQPDRKDIIEEDFEIKKFLQQYESFENPTKWAVDTAWKQVKGTIPTPESLEGKIKNDKEG